MTAPTDHMTIAEIIHDFATRQGDLTDRWAREDLAAILEQRMVAERAGAWDEGRQTFFGRNPHREHRPGCGVCVACMPGFRGMYLCATCGNKRCPATVDCQKWECSGSNEVGQTAVARSTETEGES